MSVSPLHDPYSALRNPVFRRYQIGNVLSLIGYQMQTTAVVWDVYRRTRDEGSLAIVGLVQFLPVLLLSLPAGIMADRLNRRRILQFSLAILAVGSLGLGIVSWFRLPLQLTYG